MALNTPVPRPLAYSDEFVGQAEYYGISDDYMDDLTRFLPFRDDERHSAAFAAMERMVKESLWLDFRAWWFKALRANDPTALVPQELRNHPDFIHEFAISSGRAELEDAEDSGEW